MISLADSPPNPGERVQHVSGGPVFTVQFIDMRSASG
jgi:hypothetical protein